MKTKTEVVDIGTLSPHVLASNLLNNFNGGTGFRDEAELRGCIHHCGLALFFVNDFLTSEKSKEELLKLVEDTYEDLKKFKAKER